MDLAVGQWLSKKKTPKWLQILQIFWCALIFPIVYVIYLAHVKLIGSETTSYKARDNSEMRMVRLDSIFPLLEEQWTWYGLLNK